MATRKREAEIVGVLNRVDGGRKVEETGRAPCLESEARKGWR